MKDYQLAWRNLWRNKRRTLITAASVFFAVFFALVMRSFQLGAYDRMFKNAIESYTGYLQLQHKDYFDDPVIDNSFELDLSVTERIISDPNVTAIVPRFESFALAAAGSRTQGVMVLGIDPEGEDQVSGLRGRLVKYRLTPEAIEKLKDEQIPERTRGLLDLLSNESFSSEGRMMLDLAIDTRDSSVIMPLIRRHASFANNYLDKEVVGGIMIGSGLSDYLKAGVGDTLVLMGQGYHGTSAAGKYVIRGIVKLPTPDIDNLIVYLPLETARELFAAPGMATTAVIRLNNNNDKVVMVTGERLGETLEDPLRIRNWHELNALLINQMDADNKSGMIMIGILYLVIAFGVFGTVLMMLAERRREFGMLVSIGMQKKKLAKVIIFEMLLIGFLGVVAGVIASLPLVIYGNLHPLRLTGELARMYEDYGFEPVMPTMLPDSYYLWQIVVVLIILGIAIAFSARRIFRLNIINAMRA
ncbi:MAG: FtsX-like permease family protein [Bacteroidales bacterium]|nr:FtsX-like permease family protein [Bacteroidales bacterium]